MKHHITKFVAERNKRMRKLNTTFFKIAEIFIGLVCAVICTYIGNISEYNNLLADAFVGFMLPIVIFLPFQINGKSVEKTHDLENSLKKLEKTNKKVYDLYFTEVNELTISINESCESLLYKCSYKPNMDLYKSVCTKLMSNFSGKSEHDYFYATAECSKSCIDWFFDKNNLAGVFLPILNEKCQAKKITDFKRLFIYNDEDLKNPVLYFLAKLHNTTKENCKSNYCNFDFKFIKTKNFRNIIKEENISDEMGVWGNHCVFMQKNDMSPKGYSFDANLITRYKSTFDVLWNDTNSKNFEKLNIDLDSLEVKNPFEKEILEILKNDENNNLSNIKNKDLSLLNIKEIQNWIQSSYPRSTASNTRVGT